MHDEEIKPQNGKDEFGLYFSRVEPVQLFAAIKKSCNAAMARPSVANPNQSSLASGRALLAFEKSKSQQQGHHAKRYIDIKDLAPIIILRQPTTESGAEDRAQHDAKAENRHGLPAHPRQNNCRGERPAQAAQQGRRKPLAASGK